MNSTKHKSILTALLWLVLVSIVGIVISGGVSLYYLQKRVLNDKIEQAQSLVEVARTIASTFNSKASSGEISKDEAIELTKTALRNMIYGDGNNEYFFVYDENGYNVIHGARPEYEGKLRINASDGKGYKYLPDLIRKAKEEGGGMLYYSVPKRGETKPTDKASYAVYFQPWGWVIGTGVYLDDLDKDLWNAISRLVYILVAVVFTAVVIAVAITRSIAVPMHALAEATKEMSKGNYDVAIPATERRDEVGLLACTIQDLAENERRMAVLEAEQKDSENLKNELISIVSHELQSPLTRLHSSLSQMSSYIEGKSLDETRKLISQACENCEKIVEIVNDFLDIDNFTSGQLLINIKQVSLKKLLSDAVIANDHYSKKYDVRLSLLPIPEDILVNVDVQKFQQIIANLISNATKFSISGASVEISASANKDTATILIKDYGKGIPDAYRSRLFKKFSQAESTQTREKSGTGLGLYICKQIVEQMSGEIGYTSIEKVGSTFWVKFPIYNNNDIGAVLKN